MESILQDLRYGVRTLWKNRVFTIAAIAALALGIGANTTIFGVINAVLLRPLPYQDPDRLVLIEGAFLKLGMERLGASAAEYVDYKQRNKVFDETAAFYNVDYNYTSGAEPERVTGARVSASLFRLLGREPFIGRPFLDEEDRAGRDDAVILSYGFWRRNFSADPNAVGKKIALDGRSYNVVGIMPSDFQFPHSSFRFAARADLWTPIAFADEQLEQRSRYGIKVLARLKQSVSLKQAEAEIGATAADFERQYPQFYRGPGGADGGWKVAVPLLTEETTGNVKPTLLMLLGAVGFVLLIACANAANLMLARTVGRRKEIAVRMAVGASRMRIVRLLLTESMLLALFGGALGLLLALWGNDLLIRFGPADIPRLKEIDIDFRVFFFALGLSLLTGFVFGIAPALKASRSSSSGALKENAASMGVGHSRLRSLIVVSEIAMSLVLLIGASLLIRSFLRLQQVSPGFDPKNLLTANISLPESKYAEPHRRAAFFQQFRQKLETISGVESVGMISISPFSGGRFDGPFSIDGRPYDPSGMPPLADYRAITSGYFQAMRMPLLKGRQIADEDSAEKPRVVVIGEALARGFFPNEDPIGKRIKLGGPNSRRPWLSIVGIVGDVNENELGESPKPVMYVSHLQEPDSNMTLIMRGSSNPMNFAAAARAAALEMDREQPLYNIATMEQALSDSVSQRRFSMIALILFAFVALIMASVGIYGVVAYTAAERTREIGIRMALGADRRDIFSLILRQGMRLTFYGVAIGIAGAAVLTRFLSSLLYGVSANDPAAFAAAPALLALIAMAACYLPARRATKVDPMVALRYE